MQDSNTRHTLNSRYRLDDANQRIAKLKDELEQAKATIAEQGKTIAALEKTLMDERHHWGHDLTETKAKYQVLLREHLVPLLSDAIDALEIDSPLGLRIALRRVKSALEHTKQD